MRDLSSFGDVNGHENSLELPYLFFPWQNPRDDRNHDTLEFGSSREVFDVLNNSEEVLFFNFRVNLGC